MSSIKSIYNTPIFNKVTSVIRVFIGFLFIYSALSKFNDLSLFGESVKMYGILADYLVPYFSILLPGVEIVIGIMLLLGIRIQSAALVSAGLMLIFIIAISINFYQGEDFDCGCFETGWMGISSQVGWPIIIRNIIWFSVSLVIYFQNDHKFSLEKYLKKDSLN